MVNGDNLRAAFKTPLSAHIVPVGTFHYFPYPKPIIKPDFMNALTPGNSGQDNHRTDISANKSPYKCQNIQQYNIHSLFFIIPH